MEVMRFAARQTPMPTLRRIRRVLLGTLLCVSFSLHATADQLARRGTLGAGLREPAAGRAGSEIVSIQPDSAAARAGLRVGDRVLRIDQTLLTDEIARQTALAELRAGRRVALQVVTQDGSVSAREITPEEVPREQVPGLELEYGSAVTDAGHRVRTILSRPAAAGSPLPAVVVVGWLSCDSVEAPFGPRDGFAELIRRVMTQSGAAVMRVDKPGVGDSEGVACADLDFHAELAAYRAAFRSATAHPWVDAKRIVLFGLSNGGGIAPLVSEERPIAGYIVAGGWARTWFEHMMFTLRVEEGLRERSPAEISDRMRGYAELYTLYLIEKLTPAEAIRQRPHLAALWSGSGRHQYGRPAAFYQQLQALNLEREWSEVSVPVLALHGGHDRLMSREDHALIVDLVNRRRAGLARLVEYPRMDHGFYLHDSMAQSFRDYRSGTFNDEVATMTVEWLKATLAK